MFFLPFLLRLNWAESCYNGVLFLLCIRLDSFQNSWKSRVVFHRFIYNIKNVTHHQPIYKDTMIDISLWVSHNISLQRYRVINIAQYQLRKARDWPSSCMYIFSSVQVVSRLLTAFPDGVESQYKWCLTNNCSPDCLLVRLLALLTTGYLFIEKPPTIAAELKRTHSS